MNYTKEMERYRVINKKVGETPLVALTAFTAAHPEYKNIPISYAGRLDPMASGKLLLLLGEECKQQKAYTKLDKEYEVEVLLDIGSDTGDALGLVHYSHKQSPVSALALDRVLRKELGCHDRPYPHFSSKTVAGKPLFVHALEQGIHAINIPTHEERLYRITLEAVTHVPSGALKARVGTFLTKVPRSTEPSKRLGADFRIDAVQKSWEAVFAQAGHRTFAIAHLRIVCGSGTYMRALAGRIGQALGTSALALSIHRTKIGTYWWGFWLKELS
jgi:tRNA U55 pseudouridine synthase TruB